MSDDTNLFSGTIEVPERHRFDPAALDAYLKQHMPEFRGPLTVELCKGGQSNPTYKLITPQRTYAMRAKPGPVAKLLPSAHAIEREYKVMTALAGTDVPVPRTYCLCEDESVIGRAFFVMDFVEGRVLWDQGLPGETRETRAAIYLEMNRVMAALHLVDYKAIGLGDFGKPGNYFARQIGRWSKQYQISEIDKIPEMDRLIEWLPAHIPDNDETTIVHGDFRLDNLVFANDSPRLLAVLDWELCTLGHPLADFSYHCMSWRIPPAQFRGIAGLDLPALGIPGAEEYVRMYCARTGRSYDEVMRWWDFYMAYNMFRLAAILQGIVKRVVDGTASNTQAAESADRVRPLAVSAWESARRMGA